MGLHITETNYLLSNFKLQKFLLVFRIHRNSQINYLFNRPKTKKKIYSPSVKLIINKSKRTCCKSRKNFLKLQMKEQRKTR